MWFQIYSKIVVEWKYQVRIYQKINWKTQFLQHHPNMISPPTMMTSSNVNIFRVTGHWCGEFTGPRWIPCTKASDAELWCFHWSAPNKRFSKQWWGWLFETPSCPLRRHCYGRKNPISWFCSWTPANFIKFFVHHFRSILTSLWIFFHIYSRNVAYNQTLKQTNGGDPITLTVDGGDDISIV